MIVINFIAGPGSGKTTLTAGVFTRLKLMGVNCEVAWEYPKEHAWQGDLWELPEQPIYFLAKQLRRLARLEGKVDVALTDGPLLLASAFAMDECQPFHDLVLNKISRFENHNYFVVRHKPYLQAGRVETEDEAHVIDQLVRQLLEIYGMPYADVPGNADGVEEVAKRTVAALMRRNTGNRPT